jgi:predicted transcriptional regulator
MTIEEIAALLHAEVLTGADKLDLPIVSAFGADMMSEVLAFVNEQGMLITGLTNPQVVRTAEMMDISCIAFVRGKRPDQSVIDLARERGIILLTTNEKMFSACGKLYEKGVTAG